MVEEWDKPESVSATAFDIGDDGKTESKPASGADRKASTERPAVNPVLTVENWGSDKTARLTINGKAPGKDLDVRQGVVRRPNGVNALVVWMETTCREDTNFGIGM